LADTFGARIAELKAMVGDGELRGTVIVDQIYAHYQHEGLDFKHPHGGEARFLAQPLLDNRDRYLQHYADQLLHDGGQVAMAENMENLAGDGGVATHAPVLYNNLRRSGHPVVTSDGAVIYDRPPEQHRLSEEELRAIYREHHPVPSKHSLRELRFLWATGIGGHGEHPEE
jgi:hypothetical protein